MDSPKNATQEALGFIYASKLARLLFFFVVILFVMFLNNPFKSLFVAFAAPPAAKDLRCDPPGCVDNSDLASDSVTGAEILDDSVTAADIADGAGSSLDADMLDGKDSSDFAPADHFHTSNGGVAFQAHRSSDLVVSNNTPADFAADVVEFDTHSYYDTATGVFQPEIAGIYMVYFYAQWQHDGREGVDYDISAHIFRNSLEVAGFESVAYSSQTAPSLPIWESSVGVSKAVFMNGTTDQLTFEVYQSNWPENNKVVLGRAAVSYVGAHLVAGAP